MAVTNETVEKMFGSNMESNHIHKQRNKECNSRSTIQRCQHSKQDLQKKDEVIFLPTYMDRTAKIYSGNSSRICGVVGSNSHHL